ncbi:YkgJ family cysteine cluster protein [Avibacterium paragallinarum]|uniref:YkgJ family cysteine cluster protein n=1 Tax=Avibacterium paragallinarum TaxID=728 RepID=A0ABU7QSY8_AVIPA|nr:YkgJ family cysteine cluster protein [Avibacterium paragallinarum]
MYTNCGRGSRRVNLSEQTRFLDRGDGVCHHFNERTNLCSIYQNRPLVCRVKDYYLAHLSNQYSWEEFVRLNIEVCEILKKG